MLGRVATLAAQAAPGQAQGGLHALHRHRRSRRRRQRRRGQADRPQGRPEDVSPPQRLRRRPARRARGRGAQAPAGRLVEEAVRGMLPKTKMGDAMYRKLKVYARADHPHTAQQPTNIEVAVTLASTEYYATGRRKTSAARVFLRPGTGVITVNHREFQQFFPTEALRDAGASVRSPSRKPASSSTCWPRSLAAASTARPAPCASGIARALVDYNARATQGPQERRPADVGFAGQGTEEVRPGWRAQALPVQQALGEGGGNLCPVLPQRICSRRASISATRRSGGIRR